VGLVCLLLWDVLMCSSVAVAGGISQGSYSASKAGLAVDTVVWGRELAKHNIRVGAVAPGAVEVWNALGMKVLVLDCFMSWSVSMTSKTLGGVFDVLECLGVFDVTRGLTQHKFATFLSASFTDGNAQRTISKKNGTAQVHHPPSTTCNN